MDKPAKLPPDADAWTLTLNVLSHGVSHHAHTAHGDDAPNPHFAAIGGEAGVVRLIDSFYHHMETMPVAAQIRALHPAQLGHVKEILRRYMIEWTGGPRVYSVDRGAPRLRHRHSMFTIGEAERDAWMLCMRAALAECVPDLALRAELDTAFYKVANAIRNADEQITIRGREVHE